MVGADDGSALHAVDTIAAGSGLCMLRWSSSSPQLSPAPSRTWHAGSVAFDRSADGRFSLGLEAAHGRHRLVHASGDGTGREILRVLIVSVPQTAPVSVLDGIEARRLMMADGKLTGVLAQTRAGPLLLPRWVPGGTRLRAAPPCRT